MSRKNRKPIYTLSQDEAERLVAEVKNSVEKLFVMPAAGERNAEFHVLGDDGEKFTIAMFKGAINAELLVMPGETCTLKWLPVRVGVAPFYCTDFCSALHQEMQGYARVSPAGSDTPLKFGIGDTAEAAQ